MRSFGGQPLTAAEHHRYQPESKLDRIRLLAMLIKLRPIHTSSEEEEEEEEDQ